MKDENLVYRAEIRPVRPPFLGFVVWVVALLALLLHLSGVSDERVFVVCITVGCSLAVLIRAFWFLFAIGEGMEPNDDAVPVRFTDD